MSSLLFKLLMGKGGVGKTTLAAAVAVELHKIADESQVHILLISHINRSGAQAGPPSLQELKGSASIEQDADVVILLHRPEGEDQDQDQERRSVMIAKQRNGPVGTVKLTFWSLDVVACT